MGISAPVILIDATGYLFQAFHALPPLTNSKGEPTGAIYGLINTLRKLKNSYPSSNHIVVFDAPGPTFRNELYAQYKANRPPISPELRQQIKPSQELVEALGLPILVISGVEADDVIGTLTHEAVRDGHEVLICTSDKDMAQLVNDKVKLLNSKTGTVMDAIAVNTKFGVMPEQIIDYLTLVGDQADNIPGVPKVGPKTASKWLAEYQNLAGVLEHQQSIGGKVGENLRAVADRLPLSKQLATIKCDVKLPASLAMLQAKDPDIPKLQALYQHFEYRWLLAELNDKPAVSEVTEYHLLTTAEALSEYLSELQKAASFACYIATNEAHYMHSKLIGIALSTEAGKACYIPLQHNYLGVPEQLPLASVLAGLKPLLVNEANTIIGHDLKYGLHVLARYGLLCQAKLADNMLASYVLNSTSHRHDFFSSCRVWLNQEPATSVALLGKGHSKREFNAVRVEEAIEYAAQRADFSMRLYQHTQEQLQQYDALQKVFADIEMPLLPVLAAMERHGALADGDQLQKQSVVLKKRLQEIATAAYQDAGGKFNLDSPMQLQEILYEKMSLPVLRKTPKGQPSTAEPVLAELALQYDLPKLILEYRNLAKLKSTYADRLPEQINADTGRIHTCFHQAVTSTGRLSSTDPNLQNIPVRTESGRLIKRAFIAPLGKKLIAADYSQIELRIMAHVSADEGLVAAFRSGQDVHRATAAEILRVPAEEVSDLQRRDAKVVNFGLIYGMSSFGLSRQLGISTPQAKDYIDTYFERYPGVKSYMDSILHQARQQGYVETLFGRRLYLPNIKATNRQLRQASERAAINAPIQGTAADIIKYAMLEVDRWLAATDIDATMFLQVHDELLFEVGVDHIANFTVGLQSRMAEVKKLAVPLVLNVGVGDNWIEAH